MDRPRVSRPHRCNDRVEDLVQCVVGGGGAGWAGARTALANLAACLASDVGREPTPADAPYVVLADGAPYLTPREVGKGQGR